MASEEFSPEAIAQQAMDALGEFSPLDPSNGAAISDGGAYYQKDVEHEQRKTIGEDLGQKEETKEEEGSQTKAFGSPEEAVQNVEPPKQDPADKWNEKFERLSKQDARLRAQAESLKAREQEIREYDNFKREFEADPARAIARLGVSPDRVFDAFHADESAKPQRELDAFKEQMKRDVEAVKEEFRQYRQVQQANAWDKDFKDAFSDPEFAIVKAFDPNGEMVMGQVADHYNKTGEFLTPREFLGTIKEALKPRFAEMQKLAQANSSTGEELKKAQSGVSAQRTITNSGGESPARSTRFLSNDERMEELIAEFSAH